MWAFVKMLFTCICGCTLLSGLFEIIFGANMYSQLFYFISCWFWCSYCWNYYIPAKNTVTPKKDDDNDVDFKDLK